MHSRGWTALETGALVPASIAALRWVRNTNPYRSTLSLDSRFFVSVLGSAPRSPKRSDCSVRTTITFAGISFSHLRGAQAHARRLRRRTDRFPIDETSKYRYRPNLWWSLLCRDRSFSNVGAKRVNVECTRVLCKIGTDRLTFGRAFSRSIRGYRRRFMPNSSFTFSFSIICSNRTKVSLSKYQY